MSMRAPILLWHPGERWGRLPTGLSCPDIPPFAGTTKESAQ